jgi:predicted phosphodiesterase
LDKGWESIGLPTFNLLHLSDLHFAVEPERANPYLERRIAEGVLGFKNPFLPNTFCPQKAVLLASAIEDIKNDIHAILITGDLATTGMQPDLDSAKNWIAGSASHKYVPHQFGGSSTVTCLGDLAGTLILMPGNHDRYQGAANDPGSAVFENVFGTHWDLGRGNVMQPVNPRIRRADVRSENEALIILCADFSLIQKIDATDSLVSYMGQGKAYKNIVDALVAETRTCRETDQNACIVWATHFPPQFKHDTVNVGPELALINDDVLLDAASKESIKIIFSGHTHVSSVYRAFRDVYVVCAGTPTSYGRNEIQHSFNAVVLTTARNKLATVSVMRYLWDKKMAVFEPDGTEIEILL